MTPATVTPRLSKKEAADYLRISIRQLQRLMVQGRIGYTRAHGPKGDVALFEESELERFADERSKQVYVPTRPPGPPGSSDITGFDVIPSQNVSLSLSSSAALVTQLGEAIAKAGAETIAQLRTAKVEPTLLELDAKAWLTRKEAVRLSGLPSKIIYEGLLSGALGVKFGGRWIIRRTQLEKFATQWSPRRMRRAYELLDKKN